MLDRFNLAEPKQSLTLVVFFVKVLRLELVGRPHVIFQNLRYDEFLLQLRLVVVFGVVDVCFVGICRRSFDFSLEKFL